MGSQKDFMYLILKRKGKWRNRKNCDVNQQFQHTFKYLIIIHDSFYTDKIQPVTRKNSEVKKIKHVNVTAINFSRFDSDVTKSTPWAQGDRTVQKTCEASSRQDEMCA